MRPGETPVPIPNTTVKTRTAESTALETVWEARWLPDLKKEKAARQTIDCGSWKQCPPAVRAAEESEVLMTGGSQSGMRERIPAYLENFIQKER